MAGPLRRSGARPECHRPLHLQRLRPRHRGRVVPQSAQAETDAEQIKPMTAYVGSVACCSENRPWGLCVRRSPKRYSVGPSCRTQGVSPTLGGAAAHNVDGDTATSRPVTPMWRPTSPPSTMWTAACAIFAAQIGTRDSDD